MGAHGEICKRVSGKIMMTVRPQPEVLTAEDCAMILGYRCLGGCGGGFIGEPKTTEHGFRSPITQDAVEAIAYYERKGKLTQKKALRLLSDSWVLTNYTNYTDMIEQFDEDNWNHRAIRAWVLRVFPKFSTGVIE
tara:strand:+ start:888 stop:1292 length:405 start_codon:yes stop_codon:yes gene_type:complete